MPVRHGRQAIKRLFIFRRNLLCGLTKRLSIRFILWDFAVLLTRKSRITGILRVLDWVEHIKKTGATCVLFNPLMESDYHGYDTRDHLTVDSRLGTEEDLQQVCKAIHAAGMKVMFDGVFNHVGRGFWAFQDLRMYFVQLRIAKVKRGQRFQRFSTYALLKLSLKRICGNKNEDVG